MRLHAETERLLSDDHFTVDGTLLKAWASQKSFHPAIRIRRPMAGGNPTRDFHGQRRATTRISRPPIPMRGCIGKREVARRTSATWGMCSWSIGQG